VLKNGHRIGDISVRDRLPRGYILRIDKPIREYGKTKQYTLRVSLIQIFGTRALMECRLRLGTNSSIVNEL